jgi:hypothetical protein
MSRPAALRAGESLLQTLWVGALWTTGYLVAPALFAHLPDRALAGEMAGRLFSLVTWVSLVCAIALLLAEIRSMRPAAIRRLRLTVVGFMAACLAGSEWLVRPLMRAARLADGTPGPDFGLMHGISAALWLLASLAGLLLVVSGTLRVTPRGD